MHHQTLIQASQYALESIDEKFLGLVEESVVGLSHLFRTAADTNGALLKRLAAFLGRSCETAYGIEIVLRRNNNVPADVNAVSILVPNPDQFSEGGEIPLLALMLLSFIQSQYCIPTFSFTLILLLLL